MFSGNKEREHQTQSDKWQNVTWDGISGFARLKEGEDSWEFSVEIPDEADPQSVVLGSSTDLDSEEIGYYTVSYRIKDKNFWRFLEVPMQSEEGNLIVDFSAHTIGGFEKEVGFFQINRGSPREL